jgi:organic hydroperoxide reductase OsmC/OhrA
MATFIGISENSRLTVLGYRSEARGRLERVEGRGLQFTEIVIAPTVELARMEDFALAEKVMAKAETGCLIANSLLTHVRVEPTFVQGAALAA